MIKINHVAIWTTDIEIMKDFYVNYFSAKPSSKYINDKKKFTSYFLEFPSGAKLELMSSPNIINKRDDNHIGLAHIAVSVGSKELVDQYTENFVSNGYHVVSAPRVTGDGYYESVINDPEGNIIEITI